jgi:hypothetical protein
MRCGLMQRLLWRQTRAEREVRRCLVEAEMEMEAVTLMVAHPPVVAARWQAMAVQQTTMGTESDQRLDPRCQAVGRRLAA